uniref:Protein DETOXIFICATION n=1 Tax=Salix viminalis TaxID=40686 RepID=A0A6N2LDL8_SALVM
MSSNGAVLDYQEAKVPLLKSLEEKSKRYDDDDDVQDLPCRVWIESKKLWQIVGPAIFSRLTSYSMFVITQAFAGHLGDLELAGISIANSVIVGFDFGLLLGMASALETLCGQAFGAKKYYMLGVYMQRSWIVLFICCVLLLPLYLFASPVLKLFGQPDDIAELSGKAAVWMIPLHFSFAFQFPLQRFLQSQLKNMVIAWVSLVALVVHIFVSWLLVYQLQLGVTGTAMTLNFSWWVLVFGLLGYTVCGGCPLTWKGFSTEAFSGLWEFTKLSAASGVMLCLENWYYRILILMTGNLKNAEIAVDALSICMTINGWEMMIPLAFFAGTGVRVANELGAGNGKGAKFATIVSVTTSVMIGLVFWLFIMFFHDKLTWIFTSSEPVLEAVNKLSILLAFTVLLNSRESKPACTEVVGSNKLNMELINFGRSSTSSKLIKMLATRGISMDRSHTLEFKPGSQDFISLMSSNGAVLDYQEAKVPLLKGLEEKSKRDDDDDDVQDLACRVWIESKKLWQIVGPAIFSRLTSYSMFVITQAFAGHLGDLELAGISIANTVIVGFDFGLLGLLSDQGGKSCYYGIGVPLGFLMGWIFHQGVMAEKANLHVLKWSEAAS